MLKRNKRR